MCHTQRISVILQLSSTSHLRIGLLLPTSSSCSSITFTGNLCFSEKKIMTMCHWLFFSSQVKLWELGPDPRLQRLVHSGLFPFSTIDWQFLEYPRFSIEFHPLWSRMISALLGAWTPFSSFLFLQPLFLSPSSTLSPSSLTSATWS